MTSILPAFLAGKGPGPSHAPIGVLVERSESYYWAWAELMRRLTTRLDENDQNHGQLCKWAAEVATGRRTPPRKQAHQDRDMRVTVAVDVLMANGWSKKKAVKAVSEHLNRDIQTVRSILRTRTPLGG